MRHFLFFPLALVLWTALPLHVGQAAPTCPVLYRYSSHTCYSPASAFDVARAERQMPMRVLDPVVTVRRFTTLPLTSVIVDRMSRSRSRIPRAWVIDYVFGNAPDLGLPHSTVSPNAHFLAIGEAVGHITMTGFDTPRFLRIRVNSRGRAIWHVAVNLPGRDASLVIHSTLSRARLGTLTDALIQRSRREK